MEEQQVLPNGVVRKRGLPLAEKFLPSEEWQECVHRALQEELGTILEGKRLIYSIQTSEYRWGSTFKCEIVGLHSIDQALRRHSR